MRLITERALISFASACVCAVALAFLTFGAPTSSAQGKNGKDLYKQNCRVCHEKNSPNGEYSPMSLTQDQWKNFFKNGFVPRHKEAILPGLNKKLFETLTPEQLKAIEKYAVDHAADSEQPQTCSG